MPAEPKDDSVDAMPAGAPGVEPARVGRTVAAPASAPADPAPAVPTKPSRARKKKAPQPTFDDGATTRVFKFPSRAYPKSSYYVTGSEIIVRIKKARKKWKLVIPKNKVASYRTNRWFTKPRWVEIELTYPLALKHGLIDATVMPVDTDASHAVANMSAPDPEAVASVGGGSAEPAHEPDAARTTPAPADRGIESALMAVAAAAARARTSAGTTAMSNAAATDGGSARAAEPSGDAPVAGPRRAVTRVGRAPPPSPGRTLPVVIERKRSVVLDVDRAPSQRDAARAVWLIAPVLAMLLLTCGVIWWQWPGDDGPEAAVAVDAATSRPPEIVAGPALPARDSTIVTAGIDDAGKSETAVVETTPRPMRDNVEVSAAADTQRQAAQAREKIESEARARLDAEATAARQAAAEAARRTADADAEVTRRAAELAARAALQPIPIPEQAPAGSADTASVPCRDVVASAAGTVAIRFEFASASLSQPSLDALNRLAATVKSCPAARMTIEGHTDSDGDLARNQRLSERRAQAVRQSLVDAGIRADQLSAIGRGQARPVAPNDTSENKRRNRRIELVVE